MVCARIACGVFANRAAVEGVVRNLGVPLCVDNCRRNGDGITRSGVATRLTARVRLDEGIVVIGAATWIYEDCAGLTGVRARRS